MEKIKKKKKGFTLIEVVVTISILIIVFAMAFPPLYYSMSSLDKTKVKSELQENGQNAMEYITKSAMEANRITKKTGNNIDPTSISEIEFSTTAAAAGITTGTVTYNFKLDRDKLKYTDSTGVSDYIVATNIKSIVIKTDDDKSIDITINLNENNEEYSISNKIHFRNSNIQ